VRIDHFRGFESFYAIPYGSKDAKNGKWLKGPDMDLFNEFKKEFGDNLPIIAEDLGFLTEEVLELLSNSGFPGMKVLQFAFDSREDSDYLPHNYNRNCVVYTGTHDNDTIIGWTSSASPDDVEMARKYLHVTHDEGFNWAMMRAALSSVADTCILMMHDFMGLGSEARINTPSTLGNNWQWRIDASCINDWLAGIIKENAEIYGRKRI
jgi:4-alpha-glucanotransferase